MDVERRSLGEIVQEQGPLAVRDAVGWITRASKTLAFIHDQGRVHGAICADALLLADTDCNADGALCHPNDLPEAAEYHSRARVMQADNSVEDDVWALCVTLFYAVTGVLPYPRGVTAWLEAGNRQSPPAAMYGSDLSGMDAVLGLLLDPSALPDEIPTAIMLANQLAMFSPATAPLPPLQLQTPHAGPLDMDETLERMAPLHSAADPKPALPSPDDDTSLPSQALLLSLPPAPPDTSAPAALEPTDVPSARRPWLLLVGIALLLFALGFLGAWLFSS